MTPQPPRPWAIVAATTAIGLPIGTIYAFSVLLKPLEALLHVSRSELAFVFGLSAIGFTGGMNLAPMLFGRVSGTVVLIIATVFNVAGLGLSALAQGTTELAIGYGVMFGVASGVAFTLLQQCVNLAVRSRQGLVNGYLVSLFPAGAMIGAPVLGWLVETSGVRWALASLSFVFAVLGLVTIILYRLSHVKPPAIVVTAASQTGAAKNTGTFWKIFFVFFLAAAAGLMVLSQAAGIVASYGASATVAVFATTGITGAIATARITGGWLVDKFPVPLVMAFAQLFALAGTIALTLLPSASVAVVSLAMIGMGYGIISGSSAAAIGLFWPKAEFGRVASRVYIAWCIAAVSLPLLAARLFDLTGGYASAIIVAGCGNLLGAMIASTLRAKPPQGATQAA